MDFGVIRRDRNNGMTKNKTKIKEYMAGVRDYLTTEYGEVKKEWEITLVMLEDNLYLYEEIKQSIKDNGIYSAVRAAKNPLLSTLKDTQATILKISQKLGVSPYDKYKVRKEEVEDTDEFIDNLMGGEDND